MKKTIGVKEVALVMLCSVSITVGLLATLPSDKVIAEKLNMVQEESKQRSVVVDAKVTGYNTLKGQTDSTPCISASGDNICGRTDVVACPRHLPLGTKVKIENKMYVCLDRMNKRFNDRFDISCDKDTLCPPRVTGVKKVEIFY
jgi:hypothetical protein